MSKAQEALALEARHVLNILRAIGTEEQRIAFAVMEGMRLQKVLDAQRVEERQGQRDRPT